MSHRQHLFSLRVAFALREVFAAGYGVDLLHRDLFAGVTVGVIAIPLAMALAIASGVPPQYGLYTAMIGGAVIAVFGGSRYSISGPTAAFVVILVPLVERHGLGGLLVASVMAGVILIAMALARLGRFIEYIPESVTLGFTGGIAIVIAVLQLPDFAGLSLGPMPTHFVDKVVTIVAGLGELDPASTLVAFATLAVMFLWSRLGTPVPPHLPALIIASVFAVLLSGVGLEVDTIASRFQYLTPEGTQAAGIPPYLPDLAWPWRREVGSGAALEMSWSLLSDLLPAAFAIAMLGAIESLLCAVVLDGMSGRRHSANSELLAQGLANVVTPFFGGITATAAIARSATNFKAGAVSPLSALTHSLVVFLGLVFFAGWLAYLPMPAMAVLLIVVAWNMSEAPRALELLKRSPGSDVLVFITCLSLTVLFDMVIAITVGVLLASLLFMKDLAAITRVVEITDRREYQQGALPSNWKICKIRGALFFAAADRIFAEIAHHAEGVEGIVVHMRYSSYLDAGGASTIQKLMSHCEERGIVLYFSSWQFQPLKTLARARGVGASPLEQSFRTLAKALEAARRKGRADDPR